MDINLKNIPKVLKKYDQWVCWNYEIRSGKPTKIPMHAVKGYRASIKKPKDWFDFTTCMEYSYDFDGIGYVLSMDDPFVIWDLDDCYNVDSKERVKTAASIVEQLNSYTEISPSGKGFRVIVKAKIERYAKINRKRKLEVYQENRFLTITGNHLPGTPKRIKPRQDICYKLHQELVVKESAVHCKKYRDPRIPLLFG